MSNIEPQNFEIQNSLFDILRFALAGLLVEFPAVLLAACFAEFPNVLRYDAQDDLSDATRLEMGLSQRLRS